MIQNSKGANTAKQTELGLNRASHLPVPVPALPQQQRLVEQCDCVKSLSSVVGKLSHHRRQLAEAILPAARNGIFNAMR